jgi:hypothetical protein
VPDPAGAVTVIWVSDTTVKLDAAVGPNDTPVAPVNPVPVMVTTVPATPEVGLKPVIAGAAGVYANVSPDTGALVPPGPVTVTSTEPDPAGAVAVICVSDTTENVAATPPKETVVAPVNPVPVTVTTVPAWPDIGLTPETVGKAAAV